MAGDERQRLTATWVTRRSEPLPVVPDGRGGPEAAGCGVRLGTFVKRGGGRLRIRRSRRAGGPRPHRGGAGGRSWQRKAGAVDGRRERPKRPAGGEHRPARHRGDARQRDDAPRRGGVRRARGLLGDRGERLTTRLPSVARFSWCRNSTVRNDELGAAVGVRFGSAGDRVRGLRSGTAGAGVWPPAPRERMVLAEGPSSLPTTTCLRSAPPYDLQFIEIVVLLNILRFIQRST